MGGGAAVFAYGSSCDLRSLALDPDRPELVRLRSERRAARRDPCRAQPPAGGRRRHVALGPQGHGRGRGPPVLRARRARSRGNRASGRCGRPGGRDRGGRLDDHAAARPRSLHLAGADGSAEAQGGLPGDEARRRVGEAADPDDVPEPRLLRRTRHTGSKRRRGRTSRSTLATSRSPRPPCLRDYPGAVDLQPVHRPGTRCRPPQRGARGDARDGRDLPSAVREGRRIAARAAIAAARCTGRSASRTSSATCGTSSSRCTAPNTVRYGGLRVYTTIRPHYQRLAEEAIRSTLTYESDPAAALISISPRTGAIRAMAAVIPDQPKNQFNLLSQARRGPGSTFKMFVLAAAVEMGINPDSTYYVSAPFTYKTRTDGNCDDGSWWCVHTYDNSYSGWSSIRSATIRSDNSVYAQLTLDVTPERIAEVAQRMGVRTPLDVNGAYVPAMGLGSIAVSPLDIGSGVRDPRGGWCLRGADGDPQGGASRRPRGHRGGMGCAEAPPRDLRRNRGDRDADPRAEHPVRDGRAREHPAGLRPARPVRTRITRTHGSRAIRRISRRRSGWDTRRARSRC